MPLTPKESGTKWYDGRLDANNSTKDVRRLVERWRPNLGFSGDLMFKEVSSVSLNWRSATPAPPEPSHG